jgi:hypothetical protein
MVFEVSTRSDASSKRTQNRLLHERRRAFGVPVGKARRRSKRTRDSVREQRRQPGNKGGEDRKPKIVLRSRADVADAKYDQRMERDVEFAEKWDNWKRACTDETIDACRSENRDAKGRFVSFKDDKEIGSVTHWPEEGDDFGWWVRTNAGEQSGPYPFAEAKEKAAEVKEEIKRKKSLSGGARSAGPRAAPGPAYPKYSLKPMDRTKYARGRHVMCVRDDIVCAQKGGVLRTYQSGARQGQEYCRKPKKSMAERKAAMLEKGKVLRRVQSGENKGKYYFGNPRKSRKSKPRPRSSKKK